MKRRFMEFMNGRYGADQLSKFMLGVCLVCLVLNIFTRYRILYLLALVVLGLCYFRMFSRDYAKRSAENQKYLNMVWKVKARFGKMKNRAAQSKDFHIYTWSVLWTEDQDSARKRKNTHYMSEVQA